MMTQQLGISILSAPIAALDRRALSQAWYSALHLARDRSSGVVAPARTQPQTVPGRNAGVGVARRRIGTPEATVRALRAGEQASLVRESCAERRALRSHLARRIERTFLRPTSSVKRATFRIDGANARVHIALQTSGNRVQLIAVCHRDVRGVVARALAQARFALASRGIVLDVAPMGEHPCS
ncbi:MAG: hypothetical protein ACYDGM_06670 [Vulcanimicrobiaceae bacterium]